MTKFRMVKIPTEGRIKIRGDMYGPLNTPHLESLVDIKIMLTYGVPVIGFNSSGGEVELNLENYDTEEVVEIGNSCTHDATSIKQPVSDSEPAEDPEEVEEPVTIKEEFHETVELPELELKKNKHVEAPAQEQKNKKK